MLRSLYSGVSGMRGFQAKLDVIGNNIANVNTVGFKAGRIMFKDILSQTVGGVSAPTDVTGGVNGRQIGLGTSIASIDTLHTPGSAMTTNVPTDLRIDGDGFFALSETTTIPDNPYLSRAGNFTRDSQDRLVNADGMFVLSSAKDIITIPSDTYNAFSISKDGTINGLDKAGNVVAIAKIGVVNVPNPGGLQKIGGNLYQTTPNATADGALTVSSALDSAAGTGAIITGELEMSNVDLTSEFTEMIVAQRGFQANARIITTSDEVLQEVVGLKR
jgi:flagellar hook protein FlgE